MDLYHGNIRDLLQLEEELNTLPCSIERSAKVNLLKFLQVNAAVEYERVSTALYFDLRRDAGFHELSRVPEKNHLGHACSQPMESGSVEDYLVQAEEAKACLDRLIYSIATPGNPMWEGIPAPIKSKESARRKADKLGNARFVTDFARATFVCETPHDLVEVFALLTDGIGQVSTKTLVHCSLSRTFYCAPSYLAIAMSDWTPRTWSDGSVLFSRSA